MKRIMSAIAALSLAASLVSCGSIDSDNNSIQRKIVTAVTTTTSAPVNDDSLANNSTVYNTEDIASWLENDIWNNGISLIKWYTVEGKTEDGKNIDIDAVIEQLGVSMEAKDKYTIYINSLSNDNLKSAWNKAMKELSSLYKQVTDNKPQHNKSYVFNVDEFAKSYVQFCNLVRKTEVRYDSNTFVTTTTTTKATTTTTTTQPPETIIIYQEPETEAPEETDPEPEPEPQIISSRDFVESIKSGLDIGDISEVERRQFNEQDNGRFKYKDVTYTIYRFTENDSLLEEAKSGKIKYYDQDAKEDREINAKVRETFIITFDSDDMDDDIENAFNSVELWR